MGKFSEIFYKRKKNSKDRVIEGNSDQIKSKEDVVETIAVQKPNVEFREKYKLDKKVEMFLNRKEAESAVEKRKADYQKVINKLQER